MNQLAAVRVTVRVAVDPDTAFDVFTTEIDQWYRKGATVRLPPDAAVAASKYSWRKLAEFFEAHMNEEVR